MSAPWSNSQIMMTLSGIAYYSDVSGQLKNPNYATQNDWSVVWGPATSPWGNRAYVARSESTGKYAVAIRGTATDVSWDTLYNIYQDLNVAVQRPWEFFYGPEGARISDGSYTQAVDLLTKVTSNGETLANFIWNLPPGTPVAVTGHSLGGNLATVIGTYFSYMRGPRQNGPDPTTEVYTFATPSPGNRAFSDAYNARLPQSFRYWNELDIVPCAWDRLQDIYTIYDPEIPIPSIIASSIKLVQIRVRYSEDWYKSYYRQTNGEGNKLSSGSRPLTSDWAYEAYYQHQVNTYLGLLKAPPIQPSAVLARSTSTLEMEAFLAPLTEHSFEEQPPDFATQIAPFSEAPIRSMKLRSDLL